MRKALLLLALCLTLGTMAASAQTHYRVTGNNVNMRKGPGTNYPRGAAVPGRQGIGYDTPFVLDKGQIVTYEGKRKNGFVYVSEITTMAEGWVSAKFLTPATKCTACKGRGNTGRVCPTCHGEGYGYCCNYTGKQLCSRCGGVGYK